MSVCCSLTLLDIEKPGSSPYSQLIVPVKDRPGHDRRYAIDITKIKQELNWKPALKFEDAIKITVESYLNNPDWCKLILKRSNYNGERIGLMK